MTPPSPAELLEKLWAIDVETFLIEPGNLTPRLVCLSLANAAPSSERVVSKEDAKRTFLGKFLGVTGGANYVYDLGVIAAEWPELLPEIFKALEEGRVVDTALLEALHDVARGCLYKDPDTGAPIGRYSLLTLEQRYLGKDRSADKHDPNAWRLRYGELYNVPMHEWPNEAIQYPRDDARGTFDILARQLDPEGRSNQGMIAQEMRAAWALHLMSVWGIRTDPLMVEKVVGDIEKEHQESRAKFAVLGLVKKRKPRGGKEPETPDGYESDGTPFMYQADTAAIKALVEAAYQGNPPRTEKGAVSTARETLTESGNELLEEYGEAGANSKLFSTYCDVLKQGTVVPINASYQVIMATDRTSCSSPNLQNLTRASGIREAFVPRDGWVFCSVDYNGLELVTLAQTLLDIFGHSAMADALNAGQDLHTRLAGDIAKIPYEEAARLVKEKDQRMKALRQVAKATNFGTPGGMAAPRQVMAARKAVTAENPRGVRFCEATGALPPLGCGSKGKVTQFKNYEIAPTCVVCLELAIDFRQAYLDTWVEMPEYFKICSALADGCQDGTPLKSLSKGGLLRLEPSFCAVANHAFQNRGAVLAKDALWRFQKECYVDRNSVLFNNARAVVFVHDEIFAELREEVAHECALRQAEIMVEVEKEHCPGVKGGAVPALCRRWFKNAEATYDKSGRLACWWPKDWSWEPDQVIMKRDMEA